MVSMNGILTVALAGSYAGLPPPAARTRQSVVSRQLPRTPAVGTMVRLLLLAVLAATSGSASSAASGLTTRQTRNASSPWCRNASAAAQVGMYGPIGISTGLTGPERQGVYVDVPPKVAGLFNQGLAQFWGFNPTEACRNFDTAARLAPDCALCQWGIAVCNGPNLQLHTSASGQLLVNVAAKRAQTLAQAQPNLSTKSRRLISAAQALITTLPDSPPYATRIKYAHAVCEPLPGGVSDADIDALCGGATMSMSPWNYYTGAAAGPGTFPLKPEMVVAKERLLGAAAHGLHGGPHPLAIHYVSTQGLPTTT